MKFDIKQLMQQAQKMQSELARKQEELALKTFTATSGGGMVTATVNGRHEITALKIEPSIVTQNDIDMLQDLVIAAVNEGIRQANEAMQSEMQGMMGGAGGMPGLGGLFG